MYFNKTFKIASCPEKNSFISGNVRFQFITERIIRLEWDENGVFEDRQTLAVVNRNVMPVGFTVKEKPDRIILHNGLLTVEYTPDDGGFSADNLQVAFELNGKEVIWRPGSDDSDNLGATVRTLDGAYGDCFKRDVNPDQPSSTRIETMRKIDLGKGYVSKAGWSLIDDSQSIAIDQIDGQKWVTPRADNQRQDWYLLCYGHDYKSALRDAACIFGSQPLPPRYTLGYWWSRYWAYNDDEIEDLVKSFDRMNIPLDVMVLDMDWHLEGWTGYTWDKRYFPDPDEHLAWLHSNDLKITLNLHPADGVGEHEEQFVAMSEAMGVSSSESKRIEFDITSPKYMNEYFRLLHHPEEQRGVDFWWMDWQQGESTAIPGLDTLPWINQLHWEDMEERPNRKDKRPLIFSRFGGYGAGRYNIGFSGDTYSVWQSLAFQPYFTATAANVLFGYWSHDVGGHMPGKVDPELYTRWIQYGIYSPILRTHCTKNVEAERRTWEYPSPYSDIMAETIRRRYEMVPYIYSENRKSFDTGISLCHPMYYDHPKNDEAYNFRNQYMFGSEILVAPITQQVNMESELAKQEIWLPEGQWFDTARGCIECGDRIIKRDYLLNEIPTFVREGAVIPCQVPPKRLSKKYYPHLIMDIYPGESGSYELYEDDGISTAYLKDEFAIIEMAHKTDGYMKTVTVRKKSGNFAGFKPERSLMIRLHAMIPSKSVSYNNRKLDMHYRLEETTEGWKYDGKLAAVIIKLNNIDLNEGVKITIEMPKVQDIYVSGLRGVFNRLRQANYYNVLLTWAKIIHPNERLGQELAHTSSRISRSPETFSDEIVNLRKKLPQMPVILDFLANSNHNLNPLDISNRQQMSNKAKSMINDAISILQI